MRDVFEGRPEMRRGYFWQRVARLGPDVGQSGLRASEFIRDRIMPLAAVDAAWIGNDARTMPDADARAAAFDTLLQIPFPGTEAERRRLLQEIATTDERLATRLDEFLAGRRKALAASAAFEQKRSEEETEDRDRRAHAMRELDRQIAGLRSGQFNLLRTAVALVMTVRPGRGPGLDHEAFRDVLGERLAAATEAGLAHYWRSHLPDVERERGGVAISRATELGLLGLALSTTGRAAWPTPADVRRAVDYTICVHGEWPAWALVLATAHPDAVRAGWEPVIEREYRTKLDHGPVLLKRLAWRGGPFADALEPALLSLIEAAVPMGDALEPTLATLLRRKRHDRRDLADVVARACSETRELDRFAVWWCSLLELDHRRAQALLVERMLATTEDGSQALVLRIVRLLSERAHHPGPNKPTFVGDVACLEWFVPFVFEHTSSSTENRGPIAQGRSWLLDALLRAEGGDALDALTRLAVDPRMAKFGRHLLRQRDRLKRSSDSCAPLDCAAAVAWIHGAQRPIDGPEALHNYCVSALRDLEAFLLEHDLRYPELFRSANEAALQKWLAHELERRALGRYAIAREEEVGNQKRTDIRLHCPEFGPRPVTIEVKFADKWTPRKLESGLRDQLVGQYLSPSGSNHGIYFVVDRVSENNGAAGRRKGAYHALVDLAAGLHAQHAHVARLDVVWVELAVARGTDSGTADPQPRRKKGVTPRRG